MRSMPLLPGRGLEEQAPSGRAHAQAMALMEDTAPSEAVLEAHRDHDIVHAHCPIRSHLAFLGVRCDSGEDAITEFVGTEHDLVVNTLPVDCDITPYA